MYINIYVCCYFKFLFFYLLMNLFVVVFFFDCVQVSVVD